MVFHLKLIIQYCAADFHPFFDGSPEKTHTAAKRHLKAAKAAALAREKAPQKAPKAFRAAASRQNIPLASIAAAGRSSLPADARIARPSPSKKRKAPPRRHSRADGSRRRTAQRCRTASRAASAPEFRAKDGTKGGICRSPPAATGQQRKKGNADPVAWVMSAVSIALKVRISCVWNCRYCDVTYKIIWGTRRGKE